MSEETNDPLQYGLKEGEVRLHNRFHPTRWKKGFASYHFHMPMEYEILETGQESGYEEYNHNHVRIRPLTITPSISKTKTRTVFFRSGKHYTIQDISEYDFWIARKFIRRGPNSWSRKKDRWVMKVVFDHCIGRALNGQKHWKNPFMWPFNLKDPTKNFNG
mgnify:FL=1|jgi:hypothetical protein|tara:strand:- start:230 stop:712 length:483 start_codon:yes stop_codon:yes gene_type:complete